MKPETPIRIASKLYEVRDIVRTFLGDKYHEKMKIGMDALQTLCDDEGISPLVAATRTANMFDREGRSAAALLVLAAAVEILEPST
jgi:hypothetical protein